MTYEDLLAKVDFEIRHVLDHDHEPHFEVALRSVLELHRPVPEYYSNSVEGIDAGYGFKLACRQCSNLYPCKTIEAIEKELR